MLAYGAGANCIGQNASRMTMDPIQQFNISDLFMIGHIGGHTIE
jgi:hypothetical protein